MVTCFILAGQIVLSLSTPLIVSQDDGTEVEEPIVQTIIFPKDAGVHIFSGALGSVRFELFESGQIGRKSNIIEPFIVAYVDVIEALSTCREN